MATEVGSVLQVNFVQGEDYLQNVLVYEARAANAAANAKNSEIIAENAKNIAITKADEAANSAVQAKNSENIAKQSEINALNSATQAKESENNAKEYSDKTEAHYNQFYIDLTNIRNEFNAELTDTRNEFNAELADTRNEFTIALNDTRNTFFNRLSDLRNIVSDGFYRFGNDISLINEWINLHNSAFQLTSFGLIDNNGVDIMDNDGVSFGSQMYMPITDRTLSLDGVPADAGAVGTALSKNKQELQQDIADLSQDVATNTQSIADLSTNVNARINNNAIAIDKLNSFVDSIDENFTFGDVCISDNNHEPLLDNDGVELLGMARMIVTDDTLTLQGIPADSYSVGEALSNQQKLLNGLDVIVQSWQDNFVQRVVAITDSDGNYILDNDNEELLNYAERLNTDSSLTMEGMPADAYAVGQALQAIRGLIATYHP
jgi:hypothetical protein